MNEPNGEYHNALVDTRASLDVLKEMMKIAI